LTWVNLFLNPDHEKLNSFGTDFIPNGAKAYLVNMLRRLNVTGRKHTEKAVENAYEIAELNNRLIFLLGAGRLPPHIQESVQRIVLPVGDVEKPIKASKVEEESYV